MAPATGFLEIKNLSYSYPGSSEPVFEGIDFSLTRGTIFCILGPNGSGKSTLLKCLSGLFAPTAGRITINNGRDLHELSARQRARLIGVVPQMLSSAFAFTVLEIVVMGRAAGIPLLSSPGKKDLTRALETMARLNISHLAQRPCNQISGGEWQLVLMARALTQKPSILILDEPTSHLDIGNQMKILQVISSLSTEGLTVIMASHFPDHALLVAGKAGILHGKTLSGPENPSTLLTADTLNAAFGINVTVLHVGQGIDRTVCIPRLDSPVRGKTEAPGIHYPNNLTMDLYT